MTSLPFFFKINFVYVLADLIRIIVTNIRVLPNSIGGIF